MENHTRDGIQGDLSQIIESNNAMNGKELNDTTKEEKRPTSNYKVR